MKDDGVVKHWKFTNIVISSDAPTRTLECSSYGVLDLFYGTTNFRHNSVKLENITLQNMYSNAVGLVVIFYDEYSNITIKNISAYNASIGTGLYASLYFVVNFGQLNIINAHFQNSSIDL
jgi:hypothetical protein